jgi:protein O-mannosyl-transferase
VDESAPSRARLYPLLLLCCVTLALYLQTLGFDRLSWDDPLYVGGFTGHGLSCKSLGAVLGSQSGHYGYRPVQMLSYALEAAFHGGAAWGYHLTSTLLHLAAVLLVYRFTRRLINEPREGLWRSAAFWTALLFAIFPYHAEAVCWISERKGLLACLFLLAAADADLSLRETGRWRWLAASAFFYALSLLSKSMWVTFPILALLTNYFARKDTDALPLGRWALRALPAYSLLALGAAALQMYFGNAANVAPLGETLPQRLAFVLVSCAHYAAAFLRPLATTPVNQYAWAWYGAGHPPPLFIALAGLALALAAGGALFALRRGHRGPAVALGCFLAALLPVSNLVPMLFPHGDRFLYGPSLALLIPLGMLLARPPRRGIALPLRILFVAAYAGGAWIACQPFANDLRLWLRVHERAPQSQIANVNLGAVFYTTYGRESEAVPLFERALEPPPGWFYHATSARRALENLVAIHAGSDRMRRAVELCARYAGDPRMMPGGRWFARRVLIRYALENENDTARAARLLQAAAPEWRGSPLGRLFAAHILVRRNRFGEAAERLADPLFDRLKEPEDQVRRRILQAACARAAGDPQAALRFLDAAPELRQGWRSLAVGSSLPRG